MLLRADRDGARDRYRRGSDRSRAGFAADSVGVDGGNASADRDGAGAIAESIGRLPPIGLDAVISSAALQTRIDRKYLVTAPVAAAVVTVLADTAQVLQIARGRVFRYSSVYFDTPELLAFRDHRQGRRRRFKVRTRRYLDTGGCMLEVKVAGQRGATVKSRLDYPEADADRLTATGREFVRSVLGAHPAVPVLEPVLRTDYRRVTVVDPLAESRVTIDMSMMFTSVTNRWRTGVTVAAPPDAVIVETKSTGRLGAADRALRRFGARPVSISKYCVGTALVHPELPANRWHRPLQALGRSPFGDRKR